MHTAPLRRGLLSLSLVSFLAMCPLAGCERRPEQAPAAATNAEPAAPAEPAVLVHYLEIVTPLVDETCRALGKAHDVSFGEPVAALGNARTARLRDGGLIGVRAPMRTTEAPVVRPYVLVEDIDAALAAAESAGAEVAMGRTEIPGHGAFAIYVLGGIDHGLWEL